MDVNMVSYLHLFPKDVSTVGCSLHVSACWTDSSLDCDEISYYTEVVLCFSQKRMVLRPMNKGEND